MNMDWPYLILSDGKLYDADTGKRVYKFAPLFYDLEEAEQYLIHNDLRGCVIR